MSRLSHKLAYGFDDSKMGVSSSSILSLTCEARSLPKNDEEVTGAWCGGFPSEAPEVLSRALRASILTAVTSLLN